MSWRTGMYVHPGQTKPGILKRIWLRLCPFVVEGSDGGMEGYMTRAGAYARFYRLADGVTDHRSVNILQKRPFEKVTLL